MKKYLLILILQSCWHISQCQQQIVKHVLDTADIFNWTYVSNGLINKKGNFVLYTINNSPRNGQTLTIRATNGVKQLSFTNYSGDAIFSENGKFAFFKAKGDSLGIVNLSNLKTDYIKNTANFHLINPDNQEKLLYIESGTSSQLHIQNLAKKELYTTDGVDRWWIDEKSNSLIISRKVQQSPIQTLEMINLNNWDKKLLFELNDTSEALTDLVINGSVIAFSITQKGGNNIYYYHTGMPQPELMLSNQIISNTTKTLCLGNLIKLNSNGNLLFFNLKKCEAPSLQAKTGVSVDIWNYQDKKLQSQQLENINNNIPSTYAAVVDLQTQKVTQLQYEDESINISDDGHFVSIIHQEGEWYEEQWNPASIRQCYIIDMLTGQRKFVDNVGLVTFFSPEGNYFIYRNASNQQWLSHNLQTGKSINLNAQLAYEKKEKNNAYKASERASWVAGWLPNDKKILFYDNYDIWLLDPAGSMPGQCLTKEYGRTNRLRFWISGISLGIKPIVIYDKKLILSAFNSITKENGFYSVKITHPAIPDSIHMCDCTYDLPIAIESKPIKKAKKGKGYLVSHMSKSDPPNYFYSKNLKNFKAMSDLNPHKDILWGSRQLLTWKTNSGDTLQGILHLPDDFDITRKYPVIFHYYNEKSDEYQQFQRLRYDGAGIDELTPWFTAHGYLIFTIDIHYKPDSLGASIMEAINSAADELVKYRFIDSTHMGLQGHSFGGFETNYIITHSHRFAAAVSVAGASEVIARYNTILPMRGSLQYFIESTLRTKYTLWERPDIYIDNSPILKANEVTTPLLLVNNKNDQAVPYEQGVSFFISLRRLGKPVWMLQYDGEGHVIKSPPAVLDFLTREEQFFNHFLKGGKKPTWMRDGIPAKDKGIRSGLDY